MDVPFHFPEIAYRQRGITLIESLIAIVVLSIGLLGIAGLHVQSMSTGYSAFNRNKAVLLADDLLERIQANRANVLNYDGWNIAAAATPAIGFTPSTSATQVQRDQDEWTQLLQQRDTGLPAGQASVAVEQRAGTTSSFDVTITINWTEQNQTEQYRVTSIVNSAT